jgi:hypothetical protein
MPNHRCQRKPTSPARREASSRAWRSAKARGLWHEPRRWRSVKESQIVRSLVFQWFKSRSGASEGRRIYPKCPRYRFHKFKKGRCACGFDRNLAVDENGCLFGRNRQSARKLAQRLGVSHTWVNRLARQFRSDPERQERREQTFGPSTLEQLRAEQAARQGDERYRPRRFKRPEPTQQQIDAYNDSIFGAGYTAKLRKQAKAFFKKQRDWKRDYGHLPYEE